MKPIHVGLRVRIADEATLRAASRRYGDLRRPEPGQIAWAGRDAKVSGYRRSAGSRSLYALKDAPGLWQEDWIDPI
jgi:hypothetical protein